MGAWERARPEDAADTDPALTPPGRRGRRLELAVAALMIMVGAWIYHLGPGRRPPGPPPAGPGAAAGIGADATTMPAGLLPQSAEIQLRLLDQLGGPVTLQAVDAAGHLAIMRGRRLELYQLDADRLDAPRLLGRSDIIETPILDLALAGERALLLEDEHPAVQGLIEIDLGPGFRAGEIAAGEEAYLPQLRRRKVEIRPPEAGEPYIKLVAMDLLPAADGALPHDAWIIVSSLDRGSPVVKLGRLLLDSTAARADLPRREQTVTLLDRAEIALVDGLVDLPQGARDLAVDGEGKFLYVAVRAMERAGIPVEEGRSASELSGGILVRDVSDPRSPRLSRWIQRPSVGSVVREPRTGTVFDLSHQKQDGLGHLTNGRQAWLTLGRLDKTWAMTPSVPDGRETIAVLAQGPGNDTILAIASNAEPEYPLLAATIPLKGPSGTWDRTHRTPSILLYGSSVLAPRFRRIFVTEADQRSQEALRFLRVVPAQVAVDVFPMSSDPVRALPHMLALKPVEARGDEAAAPTWPDTLGLPSDADIVEQDGFTFVLEPGKGLAVVDRKRPAAPRITRRLALPGAARMVGFAGGLAVLAEDAKSASTSPSVTSRKYEVVVLDLLDASGSVGATPSLTLIDRWTDGAIGPDLLAADGRIGQGWRDYTIYVAGDAGFVDMPITSPEQASRWTGPLPTGSITARHRLWASPQGRSWSDRLLRDAGRPTMIGTRVSTASYHLGLGGWGELAGRRGQPSDILALFAARGLLYVMDARQGLVVLDTVTDPYWARVAVPVVGAEVGAAQPTGVGTAAAAPATKDLAAGAAGPRISVSLGDGRDPALAQGYVWLTGHPQYLAPLGRQLWTEPAHLRAVDGEGMDFSGELALRDLPPTVRRAGGGDRVPVRVELKYGAR